MKLEWSGLILKVTPHILLKQTFAFMSYRFFVLNKTHDQSHKQRRICKTSDSCYKKINLKRLQAQSRSFPTCPASQGTDENRRNIILNNHIKVLIRLFYWIRLNAFLYAAGAGARFWIIHTFQYLPCSQQNVLRGIRFIAKRNWAAPLEDTRSALA